MIILGIDPGTATTGYGVIETNGKGDFKVINWGLIETDKNGFKENRLEIIYKEILAIIKSYNPHVFAFEKIFFATNAKTAIAVGQAQGVLLLAASKTKVEVVEYAPGTIKKMITVRGGEDLFEENVDSMQVEHNNIQSASKGDIVGLKVSNELKEGAEVYKVS